MSLRPVCGVAGCSKDRPLNGLMCKQHWFMVPAALRANILKSYRSPKRHLRDARGDEWVQTHRGLVRTAYEVVNELVKSPKK